MKGNGTTQDGEKEWQCERCDTPLTNVTPSKDGRIATGYCPDCAVTCWAFAEEEVK